MRGVILKFLKKIFDIREGEVLRASLMQLNIFLIISTLLIVKPTVNGLFLSEIGVEQLPFAFVLVAIFAVLISRIYARFLGRAGLNRIIYITLSVSVLLFLIFGLLLRFNVVGGWILYAFYIWVAIFAVLTASQFWILANVVFDAREAKRLFGFIGAGAIMGGIFGGYLTTLLAEWLGSENLLFIGAGMLSFCIPITIFIWKNYVQATQTKFQRRKSIPQADKPLMLILRSRHLTYLAGIIGLSVIVAKLVEYQFSAIASEKISDPDELTAFFGFWFSNFNLVSLFIQLLLTRRIVGTLGVGTSLFFLPAFIFVGAVLVFFIPELWAAIFIKMSDGSLKQSVNKAAVELLALPIPAGIKNQTKTFIDVVVDSLATGISGVMLIFLINGFELSTSSISIMIIGLIGIWFFFVSRIRKSYLSSFMINIQKVHKNGDGYIDLKNESVVSDLKNVLKTGSEQQVLYILQKLKAKPDDRFAEILVDLLEHPSDLVKEQAIRNLYFFNNYHFVEKITPLVTYSSQKVKVAAFDYLIAHSPENMIELMNSYLDDADHRIRSAALVSLAEEISDNPVLKDKFEFEKRVKTQYDLAVSSSNLEEQYFYKAGLLKAIGLSRLPEFFPLITQFFNDRDLRIKNHAVLAAGNTMHPHFIPRLINFLGEESLAENARSALKNYGKEIINVLSTSMQSPDLNPLIKQKIPSVVEKFGTQGAADMLFKLLKNGDPEVRLASVRSLNELKINYPYLNFYTKEVWKYIREEASLYQDMLSILYVQKNAGNLYAKHPHDGPHNGSRQYLIQLLESRLDTNLERIFRLLGLKYPPTDVISVFKGIQSSQPDIRTNALEYLDNLLDTGLKKVLIPIIETALLDTISEEAIRQLDVKIPDEKECFRILLTQGDNEIKQAVQSLL